MSECDSGSGSGSGGGGGGGGGSGSGSDSGRVWLCVATACFSVSLCESDCAGCVYVSVTVQGKFI